MATEQAFGLNRKETGILEPTIFSEVHERFL